MIELLLKYTVCIYTFLDSPMSHSNSLRLRSILSIYNLLRTILLDNTSRFHIAPNRYIWDIIPKSTQTSNIKSTLSICPLRSSRYCYDEDSESVFVICRQCLSFLLQSIGILTWGT